ncbi:YihY/virulence factor BrkB family protein [Pseudonocardia sp.]|jgi:membrane protein|uniref:YihY/virulence factor BrkB family protein n=1 Tax=Pseudonocardia sp. TaxID=60912 RepID=UPI0031FCADCF
MTSRTGARAGMRTTSRGATVRRVAVRTLVKAWDDNIFSLSAKAAFWQALSLPPLLLALLGSLGYVGDWFGPATVGEVCATIVDASRKVFAGQVVDEIIAPTARTILTDGRADVVSTGFVISLWAGSSAVSALVDSTVTAHGQDGVRHPVWQRLVSLFYSLTALVLAVFGLPILALGPDLLPSVLPGSWRPTAASLIDLFYYPSLGLLLVLGLTTLYKVALPRGVPWRRLLPGAVLAMVVFVVATSGLRYYIAFVTSTGYTYGALATPIAFLLTAFLLGFAVVIGAQLNNAIDEVSPAPATAGRRERMLVAGRTVLRRVRPFREGEA